MRGSLFAAGGLDMEAGANRFQRLLHLADARQAFESGNVAAALIEIDAVIAADPNFAAAQALRQKILDHTARQRLPHSGKTFPAITKRVAIAAATATLLLVTGLVAAAYQRGRVCLHCRVGEVVVPASPGRDVELPRATSIQVFAATLHVETPTAVVPEWTSQRLARLHARPQWRAAAVDVPDAALLRDLGEGIALLWIGTIQGEVDALFVGGMPDEVTWKAWRAALKPKGVIWRIAAQDTASDDDVPDAAAAAGFVRRTRVRYAHGYIAEQYTVNRQ